MAHRKLQPHNLYAELEALPATRIGEIVSGVLHAHPRPSPAHARAATTLTGELYSPFERGRGGPAGWIFLGEPELHLGDHVLVPDLAGWKTERYPSADPKPYLTVVPDWLCEIASPSTKRLDRVEKLPIYAEYGVKHCWYVDPNAKSLEVFILSGTTYSVGPIFYDSDPVTAPPFEAHTFDLGLLWGNAALPT
jgi:Uma2 family endonuclease